MQHTKKNCPIHDRFWTIWDAIYAEVLLQSKKMLCKDQKNIKKKKKNLSWLKLNSNHLDVHFFGNLLKCKYFNNSVDRSGLYLHVYILSWLAKILKFTVFRLYTKKLPHPWRDLIINAPINLSKDIWPLSTMKSF